MQCQSYLEQLIVARQQNSFAKDSKLSKRIHRNIQYGSDGLSATFIPLPNSNQHYQGDIVSAQTDKFIPQDVVLFYFEVKICKKNQQRSTINIGMADGNFPMNKHIGTTRTSAGYSSDGKCYKSKGEIDLKLHPFKQDDVVGCGINLLKKEMFFTLNGIRSLNSIEFLSANEMYPTVSMSGEAQIQFKFNDFVYDTSKIFKKEKQSIQDNIMVEEVSPYSLHLIIQEYLWSQGYLETLMKFENESSLVEIHQPVQMQYVEENNGQQFDSDQKQKEKQNSQSTPMNSLQRKLSGLQSPNFTQLSLERKTSGFQLDEQIINNDNNLNQIAEQAFLKNSIVNEERQRIQLLIKQGEIEQVIKILNELQPQYLERQGVLIALYAQQFIELIRLNKIVEAITFGQLNLSNCVNEQIDCVDEHLNPIKMKIGTILGLICYDNVETSSLRGLISQEQRERVSDFINKSLLLEMGYEDESALEICLKQLVQICENMNEKGLFAGEQFQFKV